MGTNIMEFFDLLLSSPFNNFYATFFYWMPLVLNAIAYTLVTWSRVQENKNLVEKMRENPKDYAYHSGNDFITIGSLFMYLMGTVLPIINALALIFDAGPELIKRICKRFAWLFEIKLVPVPKKEKEQ